MIEELEILADGEELEVVVEAEDVDAAAGAAGVKDHGIRGLGRQLAVVVVGGDGGGQLAASAPSSGHDVEDHGEEEERDRDDEEDAPVSVHFVGEGVVLGIAHADSSSAGTLEHLVVGVVGEGVVLGMGMIGRWRIGLDQSLSLEQFSRRRRSVSDLTVEIEGLLLPFLCRLQIGVLILG